MDTEAMSTTLGILPAAGLASRFGGMAKFMLPIPGVAGSFAGRHVQHLQHAVDDTVVATRSTLVEFVTGLLRNSDLESVRVMGLTTETCSETILEAIRRSGEAPRNFIVGLPDSWIEADDHYQRLRDTLRQNPGSVILGIAPLSPRMTGRLGQVAVEGSRVVDIVDKDPGCPHPWVWGTVGFDRALIPYIKKEDPHIGYAVRAFLADGKPVVGLPCLAGYIDCGTPADYFWLIHRLVANGH